MDEERWIFRREIDGRGVELNRSSVVGFAKSFVGCDDLGADVEVVPCIDVIRVELELCTRVNVACLRKGRYVPLGESKSLPGRSCRPPE